MEHVEHTEYFDLYTKDRVKTGAVWQRGLPLPKDFYHLAIHVCIFNASGEMLIQQRQSFKEGWANRWDLSCGGAALAGENSQTAAEREMHEELGLKISLEANRPVMTIHFHEGFDDIYTLVQDVSLDKLTLQPDEVQQVKWAMQEEIYDMIDDGRFIPYHKGLIAALFYMRNHRGTYAYEETEL